MEMFTKYEVDNGGFSGKLYVMDMFAKQLQLRKKLYLGEWSMANLVNYTEFLLYMIVIQCVCRVHLRVTFRDYPVDVRKYGVCCISHMTLCIYMTKAGYPVAVTV